MLLAVTLTRPHRSRNSKYMMLYRRIDVKQLQYHNLDMFSTHVLYVSLCDMSFAQYHIVHMFSTHVLYMGCTMS